MTEKTNENNSYDETYKMLQEYEGGVYVTGTDIPLGSYVFMTAEKQGLVKIYARYKDFLSDRPVDTFTIRKSETYVSLREEGMVVKVISCVMKKELTVMERVEMEKKKYLAEIEQLLEISDQPLEIQTEVLSDKESGEKSEEMSEEIKCEQETDEAENNAAIVGSDDPFAMSDDLFFEKCLEEPVPTDMAEAEAHAD